MFFHIIFNFSFASIIHNIPTWCNILFNIKVVIIYRYVVFKLSTYIIVSLPQLLHLIYILSAVFFSSPPGICQHLILNIENSFNNDGKIFLSFYILSAVNSMISKKGTNWDFPLCLLASIQFYHYDQFFLNW